MKLQLASLVAIAASFVAAEDDWAFSEPYYPSPWSSGDGGWDDAYKRAVEFVSQLTLAEKVNLTTGSGWMQEACVGQTGEITRLGFPSLCLQDGPLGIRKADYVTAFPAGINVGATFSKELAYLRGEALAEEIRDKGGDILLGPAIGPLGRSPDSGRSWEGFGPDPSLSGILVADTIKGIQDTGIIACAKHFILNEQEHFRQGPEARGFGYNISESLSSNIDDVTMHEMYLWPFADAVKAGVGSIMCSYNLINNSYGCGNSWTQNKLLKAELGFQGFVLSDWQAQHSGVGDSFAGLDMAMPGDTVFSTGLTFFGTNMTIAVVNETIPEWRVDDMAVRVMSAFYKVGRDKNRIPVNFNSWTTDEYGYEHAMVEAGWGKVNEARNVRSDHVKIARRVATESNVLLKNTGGLPLKGDEKFMAIIGEDAGPNTEGPNGCDNRGCANGTLAMGWGSGTAEFPYLVTPAHAIQNEILSKGIGNVQAVFDNHATEKIDKVISQASHAIVFANSGSGEGFIHIDGNEGDRKNLTLWGQGDDLIKNVSAVCNNTIVVLHTTGPVLVHEWNENPNITAIIWAGLPGQESGNALVDVLYGKVNPGGKSPFTWGKSQEEYGAVVLSEPNAGTKSPQSDFTEGIFIDYRNFDKEDIEPVYEFGFGLSYTTFSYSDLKIEAVNAKPYVPNTGLTKPAPKLGNSSLDYADYLYPDNIDRVQLYIYPWLNTTDPKESSGDPHYGLPDDEYIPENANNGSAQAVLPASGGPGGNPGLFEVLYKVTATVTNDGKMGGHEVPQAYVSLGGERDAKVALRNFDRVYINPGQSYQWTTTLTRRDISNWDTDAQDWFISESPKTLYVGSSSRKLHLEAPLPPPKTQ